MKSTRESPQTLAAVKGDISVSTFPMFASSFLNQICHELATRTKALRRHGKLIVETKQPDDFEWLALTFIPLIGDCCIFQFVEDCRASLFVRSRNKVNRGKVLVKIEDIRVINNGHAIIKAIETTIASACEGAGARVSAKIHATWADVTVDLHRPREAE
jgi:hypothetical protein